MQTNYFKTGKNFQLHKVVYVQICLMFMLLYVANLHAQNAQPNVIPALQSWDGKTGYCRLKPTTKLVVANTGDQKKLAVYLHTFLEDLNTLYPQHSFSIRVGKPSPGDIFFKLTNKKIASSNEAYQLTVNEYVFIEANEPIGAFWATRTILQMLEGVEDHFSLPKGIATDYPKFALRGFVLDVGRKFFTIGFLRDYVKFMSYYKMNDFQIHLNDNGFSKFFNNNWDSTYSAFRLENTTYPGLTAKDGSYSKKEFVQLQQLGNAYGVNIVPEIDVPAHSLAFSKAIPSIASNKYGKDHLDISNPFTYEVIDNVFREYLKGPQPVFINSEVHIGTDEYAKKEAEAFRAFTDHYIKFVESFGKKARLWGALTHAKGTTPVQSKNVTLNLWYNGYADPKEMLALGYNAISTPDGWLYIVPKAGYYYDYLNLKQLYSKWTPNMIGNQVFDENNSQIRGGSFAVWNDHVGNGITAKDVHDRVFPAMQVLAQKMWVGSKADSVVSYTDFIKLAKNIGEGPGLNIRGLMKGKDSLVMAFKPGSPLFTDQSGNGRNAISSEHVQLNIVQQKDCWRFEKNSRIELPVQGIGYDYTVSFLINPDTDNADDAVLFSSKDAQVKLNQQQSGKLGFSREGYNYSFNYKIPAGKWSQIVITGNNLGTSLYVNGELVERLEGAQQEFNGGKDKTAKVQTLFFPLQFIGDGTNSFKGYLSLIKIFNKILSDSSIRELAKEQQEVKQ